MTATADGRRPILVGYDPRTLDLAPVRFGIAAGRLTGAPVVVAAVTFGRADLARSGSGHMDEQLLGDATQALADVEAELAGAELQPACRELRGASAAAALHEEAEREDAALLVVGSKEEGVLGRVLPGTTAQRLLHGATCPVTVVPSGWKAGDGLDTIGVAFVETEEGHEALGAAHALARRVGAKLRVITVVQPRLAWYAETEAHVEVRPARSYDEVVGEHRAWAERSLQTAVAGLGDDVAIETEAFVDDEPAETLIRVSAHLDLLVCGSRGYGPLRAVLLGGVTRRVVAGAQCPVLVLPRGVRAPLAMLIGATADVPAASP